MPFAIRCSRDMTYRDSMTGEEVLVERYLP